MKERRTGGNSHDCTLCIMHNKCKVLTRLMWNNQQQQQQQENQQKEA